MGNASSASPSNLGTTPDPNTGLSELDKYLIKESWKPVANPKRIKDHGVELFIQLFTKVPHAKDYFKDFKGIDNAEVRKNPMMVAHAIIAMQVLSTYVDHLDDAEALAALVEKIVVSHFTRNIPLSDFEDFEEMFIPYLKSVTGKTVNPDTEAAWNRLFATHNAIYKSVTKGLKA